jgi:hypothetical protein
MLSDRELESLVRLALETLTEAELNDIYSIAVKRAIAGREPTPDDMPDAMAEFFEALRDELRRRLTEH